MSPLHNVKCILCVQQSLDFDTGFDDLSTLTSSKPFYGSLGSVRDNLGEPVPEGTFRHRNNCFRKHFALLMR